MFCDRERAVSARPVATPPPPPAPATHLPVLLELLLHDVVGAHGVVDDLAVLGGVGAEGLGELGGGRARPALGELAAQRGVGVLLLAQQALGLVQDVAVALQQLRQLRHQPLQLRQPARLAHLRGL